MTDLQLYLLVPLAPLAGAIAAGLFGRRIGRAGAHWAAIIGVAISFVASCLIFADVLNGTVFNGPVYTWLVSGGTRFEIGFLIDRLSALMMVVVSFVSLMVLMANNFLQLFFGWEAVGLVSYLLIGFWYTRPTAIYASLKAFLVNRVGDFGFLIGVALVLAYFGTLDYAAVFSRAPAMAGTTIEVIPGAPWLLVSAICIGLFVGAMGKSAQFPLHVWLPDSMEGPTPISALIHAATMVTAGIFMVARMSPLFELSETALSFVVVIGATTALFMALLGVVQNDIKRVIAYSTLSQLGYMTVALGVSAYPMAIFHLMTHAFFKALLFLAAGSVIIALHHEQDLRKMGGLRKYMPITYWTAVIGSVALAGIPPFAGFFSKDAIIEAVQLSTVGGHRYAEFAVTIGVFITAFYTFRMMFLAFHGEERFRHADAHAAHSPEEPGHDETHGQGGDPRESPWVVTVPLVLLAIPSIYSGWAYIDHVLFGNFFGQSIVISQQHAALATMTEEWHGPWAFVLHGVATLPFWLAVAGVAAAWLLYIKRSDLPAKISERAGALYQLLVNNYYIDRFNDWFFAGGFRRLGTLFSNVGDRSIIDGFFVNGSARLVGATSALVRQLQSGFVYQYAFAMVLGIVVFLFWWLTLRVI